MTQPIKVKPGTAIRLADFDPGYTGSFRDKEDSTGKEKRHLKALNGLGNRLYAENRRALLVVQQGMDTAGKDGTIRSVMRGFDPQSCQVTPFKQPSVEELDHDFLWRIHRCTPGHGMVSVFNRSHYEDVLVVRVEDIVPEAVWSQRYELINDFERNLVAARTRILKFYLHISPQEQLARFKQRLDDPNKHWKLNIADYAARTKWSDYRAAYEDIFRQCNTPDSPWYVIPADNKWYRNAAVAGIVRQTLNEMNPQLPPVEVDLEEVRALYREQITGNGITHT
jgi:PPK2 family polyphosphate:nucleotide phosphotransferase